MPHTIFFRTCIGSGSFGGLSLRFTVDRKFIEGATHVVLARRGLALWRKAVDSEARRRKVVDRTW